MPDAATRAATPPVTVLNGAAAEFVRGLASLFESTAPLERERIAHRFMLVVLLCIGATVRFWGLDSAGLHGDEETMAMATMHIVQDGRPILPSGMFYPRGLSELYLMAAAVQIFGESEWAFRLPSALCGIGLIALAYLAGRRFLRPQWNLAFAASIALLPELIDYSQTARMYIFMLACIAACMICIFAWERTDRSGWLVGAVVALVLGIELHALAVTCALLFLMPGVLQGDRRKFAYGLAAVALIMLAYLAIDSWVSSNYPVPPPEFAEEAANSTRRGGTPLQYPLLFDIALWTAGAVAAFLALHFGHGRQRLPSLCSTVLLLGGLAAQLMLFYHIAALLALAGAIIAYRHSGAAVLQKFWRYVIASALIALVHISLFAAWPGSIVKFVGALVGQPSVWPYVRVMEFSNVAAVLAIAATAWGLWRLAHRQRAADYWLMAVLGVWVPMFAIGFFVWNVPARYTSASLLPLLLCSFAFVQQCADRIREWLRIESGTGRIQVAAAIVLVLLVVDPATTIAAIRAEGAQHPDHKGAAQFIRSQQIRPEDIVLAEDVLQQTYYLGSVDHWLISRKHSWRFLHRVDGKVRDFYTGTEPINSGQEFEHLLKRYSDRRIFVIGSGENRRDDRREMRGADISEMLKSDRFEVLFVGRDGFTTVWRARSVPAVSTVPRGGVRSRHSASAAAAAVSRQPVSIK